MENGCVKGGHISDEQNIVTIFFCRPALSPLGLLVLIIPAPCCGDQGDEEVRLDFSQ